MSFIIRTAVAADVQQLHALILALAEFEQLSHLVVATEENLHAALFGPAAGVQALVAQAAQDDPTLLGFALYFRNYSTFLGRTGLYLEDLFVLPAHRRRGIARTLLRQLAAQALAAGCGRFEWTVLDWNTQAIAFYEGLGATVLPDWRIVRVTGQALTALAQGD